MTCKWDTVNYPSEEPAFWHLFPDSFETILTTGDIHGYNFLLTCMVSISQ